MYYLYHIPGKKIGVTRNINKRVTEVQGYKPGEFEVLDISIDIDYISKREIELQKFYGYKVDEQEYKKLFNKMKINVTEQTSTFPFPKNKLKGNLIDNIGYTWTTSVGDFEISQETIPWILHNSQTSMYNNNRTYIYNKSYYEAFLYDNKESLIEQYKPNNIYQLIRYWAEDRGLYKHGDTKTQYIKLVEEVGELAQGMLKNDAEEIKDAIGDIVVVLTNLAHQNNLKIEDCIQSAYNVISKRTGKMVNGTFIKD